MPELAVTHLTSAPRSAELVIVGPSLGTAVDVLWSECSTHLGNRYQVVGWDLPGHGHSPPATEPFSVADLAAEVGSLATTLSGGRRCWYAGVSLGGAVGFELSLSATPFEAVASLASAPKIGEPSAWTDRAQLVRRRGTEVLVGAAAQRWFAPTFTATNPRLAAALLGGLGRVDAPSYAWACEALAEFDRRHDLARAQVPVLVAAGKVDTVVPPAAAHLAARAPRVESTVVPDCGHLPPAEQPTWVASMLCEFFDRCRPRRGQRLFGDLHSAWADASETVQTP